MSRIIFYHNPRSRAAIAHWMLEEVAADYEVRPVDFEKGDHKRSEFLRLNPMGKIPVIVVDGNVITETPAIIAWLADAYPAAGLAPPEGSPERGSWYRWLFFGGSCFEPALVDKMLERPAPPNTAALGWGSYEAVIEALEQGLQPGPGFWANSSARPMSTSPRSSIGRCCSVRRPSREIQSSRPMCSGPCRVRLSSALLRQCRADFAE